MEAVHDAKRLAELQALPLSRKIQITQARIIEWYQHYNGNVCVSFSGGKDSTVLLHIARQIYPEIPAVFSNTGLEYASIQHFVRSWDNVDIVVPKMRFNEVVSTYGYPLIGKEVAEAIYYARRLRSQNVNGERERRRADLSGSRPNGNAWRWWGGENLNLIKTSTSRNRRTVLQGKWGEKSCTVSNPESLRKILTGQYPTRAGVAPIGATGEGGAFSHPGDQFGEKSQFNKEKWLPLVYTPFLISHYCCQKMKKQPMHKYQREKGYKPIIGTLAEESRVRKQGWIRHGCNAFESKNPISQPMSFWTEQDVLSYLVMYDIPIASVYGDIVSVDDDGNHYDPIGFDGKPRCNLKCTGCQRTGCAFCAFGLHMERNEKTRFQILAEIEPKKYDYAMRGGQWVNNPNYDSSAPKYDGDWLNWNPKKIWVPSKEGLGMGKVFDMVNEIYGKNFYRYE